MALLFGTDEALGHVKIMSKNETTMHRTLYNLFALEYLNWYKNFFINKKIDFTKLFGLVGINLQNVRSQ